MQFRIMHLIFSYMFLFSFLPLDSNKNKLALDVITHLVTYCCWLNVHTVPPHGEVFEIRVADGYGARWSKDGSKVRVCDYMFLFVCVCIYIDIYIYILHTLFCILGKSLLLKQYQIY